MTVKEIASACGFETVSGEEALEREVYGVYICDLLSFAMGRATEDFAWVTVMGNMNTTAVASLADVACVVLCEKVKPDADMLKKAAEQDIAVLLSDRPAFETGLLIHDCIK